MVLYKTIDSFNPGIIERLLKESYNGLLNYFPTEKQRLYDQWEKEDKITFNNYDTIGKHVLFSCIADTVIGYFSWDDRSFPKGIVGQNCIVPDYRRQGYGKAQIEKIENIFRNTNFKIIFALTGNHIFFESARKTYLSCGFREHQRFHGELFEKIEYIKEI